MIQRGVMQGDDGLAQCTRVTGIEGGVPLAVLVAEAHHHNIGLFDLRTCANGVDAGSLAVMPEAVLLGAQYLDSTVIAACMVGDGGGEADIQSAGLRVLDDLLAPVAVDFSGKIDGLVCAHVYFLLGHLMCLIAGRSEFIRD